MRKTAHSQAVVHVASNDDETIDFELVKEAKASTEAAREEERQSTRGEEGKSTTSQSTGDIPPAKEKKGPH